MVSQYEYLGSSLISRQSAIVHRGAGRLDGKAAVFEVGHPVEDVGGDVVAWVSTDADVALCAALTTDAAVALVAELAEPVKNVVALACTIVIVLACTSAVVFTFSIAAR